MNKVKEEEPKKKGRGRPPRTEGVIARHWFNVRLTDEQYKKVEKLAKKYGGNFAAFFRIEVLGEKE